MSDRRASDLVIWQGFLLLMYVSSGTLQPILIEVLTYNGACEKSTFLFILPTYVGMSMSVLSNMDALKHGKIRWAKMGLLAVIELCSAALCFTGLVCAGSAVFTVIYSSVTVYTALFSRLFFGRELHYMQWGGVFMVMLGLTSSSIGASFNSAEGEEDVGIGIIMIVIGSMFHSLVYILSESILKSPDPIAPEFLGSFMGFVGVFVFGLWQIFYTIPRFQDLILDEIEAHDGDLNVIAVTYVILVIVNFIHGVCFYHLIKSVGSTTTGILKGIQSVMVFVISHFAFCAFQRSQCFTNSKGASLVVVVCGVSCYSIFKLDAPVLPVKVQTIHNIQHNHNDRLLENQGPSSLPQGAKGGLGDQNGSTHNSHTTHTTHSSHTPLLTQHTQQKYPTQSIQPILQTQHTQPTQPTQSDNEYSRIYGSIDLSTRRDKDNTERLSSGGYGSKTSSRGSKNNSLDSLNDGSQAAQV